jgi:hypothetical protein
MHSSVVAYNWEIFILVGKTAIGWEKKYACMYRLKIILVCNHARRPMKKCIFIIAPSHGLFLTCRGENYTILYSI